MKIKQVNIIGYSSRSLSQENHFIEFVDELGKFGLEIIAPSLESINMEIFKKMTSAALNLVMSYEGLGLAQYMKRDYAIPFVMHVPVGLWGMRQLIKVLAEIAGDPQILTLQRQYVPNRIPQSEQKVVVIGEPLLVSSIGYCLRHDFGMSEVKSGSLIKNLRGNKLYKEKVFSNILLFDNENVMAQWIDRVQPDIIVGDPSIQRLLGFGNDGGPYEFIGKRGYDYLANLITSISVKPNYLAM